MKNCLKSAQFFLIFLFMTTGLFAQVPSVIEKIRIPLWSEIDAYPDSEEARAAAKGEYNYPVEQVKKTAPFLLNGMVYGWNFVYVPSDKLRGVDEYFEVTEIADFEPYLSKVTYTSPWQEDNRINVWCEYSRTDAQIQNYYNWSTIEHPVIHGRGYGELSDGFDGFTNAAKDALKNAVREYYRKILKNKPKEISGSVLIKDEPLSGINSGKYVVNLDFYLECDRILRYTAF